jgi:CheY-like chemotaxis protein
MRRDGYFSVESLRGVHVVVVCEDVTSRRLFEQVLRYCGALCTTTASSADAFRVLDQVKPDLVVAMATVQDPSGGGEDDARDFIRRLRGRKPEHAGTIPVVWVGPAPKPEPAPDTHPDVALALPLNPWDLCGAVSTLIDTGRPSRLAPRA